MLQASRFAQNAGGSAPLAGANMPNERERVIKALKEAEAGIASLLVAAIAFKKNPDAGKCPLDCSDNMTHKSVTGILMGLGNWTWSCPACGDEFED